LIAFLTPTLWEGGMRKIVRHNRPVFEHLHPLVYLAMGGLVLWFIASAWSFAASAYADYLLVIVTGFMLIAMAIPLVLWLTWHRNRERDGAPDKRQSFRDWASGEFDIGHERIRCSEAVVEILLPLAAVAFGMTLFAIIVTHAA
jgi:hypothetical protein